MLKAMWKTDRQATIRFVCRLVVRFFRD